MDDDETLSDELMTDEVVTLTRSQWEDLMRSIQNLSQANATLLETISYLLAQGGDESSVAESPNSESLFAGSISSDPYDLSALRRLVENGE